MVKVSHVAWAATYTLIVGACLSTSCVEGPRSTGAALVQGVTVSALVDMINRSDESGMLDALNVVKRAHARSDVHVFLNDLWSGNVTDYGVNPDSRISSHVRVELADTLNQAGRNGLISVREEELHLFVRSSATSPEAAIRMSALSALALFDDPPDVGLLEDASRDSSDAVFRAAVLGLGSMCIPEADEALDHLERSTEGSRADFLRETRARLSEFERNNSWCAAR